MSRNSGLSNHFCFPYFFFFFFYNAQWPKSLPQPCSLIPRQLATENCSPVITSSLLGKFLVPTERLEEVGESCLSTHLCVSYSLILSRLSNRKTESLTSVLKSLKTSPMISSQARLKTLADRKS